MAEVSKALPSPVLPSDPNVAPGNNVQRLGPGSAPSKPKNRNVSGPNTAELPPAASSHPTALRPKTVPPLQLTEIRKALGEVRAAKTPDEVKAAKERLAKVVGDEMHRLSGHSIIYVSPSPTDMRNAGKRIVQSAEDAGAREDLREAVRYAHEGHSFLNMVYLSGSIKDGQLKLTDEASQEFIADAAEWITAPERGEGTNELAHNQFTRLHLVVSTAASVHASNEVLAALVAQCRKEPGWIVSIESPSAVSELKNLIGSGNPEANAVIKEYETASNYPTP